MSLILDALRKSERRRQQTLAGQLGSEPSASAQTRLPTPWVTLIGIILLLNAVVLGLLLWHNQQTAPVKSVSNTQASATGVSSHPAIRPLAEEAETSVVPETNAEHAPPPTAIPQKTMPVAPAVQTDSQSAPLLDTLPTMFQQSLPALHLDVHSYASNPHDRFVVINMQRYVAGDTLKEGPRVIAIISQGVILEYNGTRFLLPRN